MGKAMVGNFQDDTREQAMRDLFGLYKSVEEGRSGVDAHLKLDERKIPFELKTTSKGSVTTARDFGPDHIQKWKDKHWLIGFFIDGNEFYHYGSPEMMAGWIKEKEAYIYPDFEIAELASGKLTLEDLFKVMGKKNTYSYADAKRLHKKQYSKKEYLELQDLKDGYSPKRMLKIFKERACYLIERGSTLNNPHIPYSFFDGWFKITENHKETLKILVRNYYK